MRRLTSLVPSFPASVWALQGATAVTFFGGGLVLPFEIVYLHDARNFSLPLAGAVAGVWPAVAVLGGFVGGAAIDRFGARRCAVACALLGASATAGLGFVVEPWQAFACSIGAGIATGAGIPADSSLVAAVVGRAARHGAYAVQGFATSLGIAVGSAVGGLIADTARPSTFTGLFVADAACTAAFATIVVFLSSGGPTEATAEEDKAGDVGYRDVLRRPAVVGFVALTFVFGLAGLAVFQVALPVFAHDRSGASTAAIGFVFLVNSLVVLVLQLPVARLIAGRRRLAAVAWAFGLWTLAWTIVAVAHGGADIPALAVAAALFGAGEALIVPVQGSLLADLAPERLRGRCFALQSNAYALAMTIAPPGFSFLLDRAPGAIWPLAAALAAAGAVAALAFERFVPAELRRAPRVEAAPAEAAAASL